MKLLPRFISLLAVWCAAWLLLACKRDAPEPVPVAAPPAPAQPASAPAPAPGQPAPPVVNTQESSDAAYIQETTQLLNDFLAEYKKTNTRIPKDVAEMVSLKIITSAPVLPGGKKWVIDQQTGKISAR